MKCLEKILGILFWSITIGACLICLFTVFVACDMQPYSIDTESGDWVFIGESRLQNATPVFDKNGYWEHWYLEFENGIVLNTKEWETKPWYEGKTYSIYYNPNNRKTFLEMK